MALSTSAEKALRAWIAADTWYTDNQSDERRFLHFVSQLGVDAVSEDLAIRERIRAVVAELHPDFDADDEIDERMRVVRQKWDPAR